MFNLLFFVLFFNALTLQVSQFHAFYSFICSDEVFLVSVNLPTRYGKSLIFPTVSLVHVWIYKHFIGDTLGEESCNLESKAEQSKAKQILQSGKTTFRLMAR